MNDNEAGAVYEQLCEGDDTSLEANTAIQSFYDEITAIHPEIGDVPEDRVDDTEYSPWSVEHDKSDSYMIMASVWSQADHVHDLVFRLAKKYGLAVFDPQENNITYMNSEFDSGTTSRPWWRFW